jgi:hypothetical protein
MRTIRSICFLLSLVVAVLATAGGSSAGVRIFVTIAPPPLPVYVQPVCPGDGYIWTPGYWAYGDDGYYWVPGTWVLAAEVGFLWTPGYWGWCDGIYIWHAGYWGPRVGFYGGIDYGFGYTGVGYAGGYWNSGHFFYNRYVNNINATVNTYNETVINNTTVSRVSFNGGYGGTTARPSAAEEAVAREHHISATFIQERHQREASTHRSQFASVNRGKPAIAATTKPADFSMQGVVGAKAAGGHYVPAANRTGNRASANSPTKEARPAETSPGSRESRPAPHENKPVPEEHSTPTVRETKPLRSPSHTATPRTETRPSSTREHGVTPRSETKPLNSREHAAPPGMEHKLASSPHATAPRQESKPTQRDSASQSEHVPPAHAQSPRSTAPPAQRASRPPAQHESTPRPQSKPQEHRKSEHPQ